ncbi:hypothetical protein EMCRGX_G033811 [Ephydatia muelleri]|eukprot:Em0022g412a
MAEDAITERGKRACSGLREELLDCLLKSDCVRKHGLTPRQCLQEGAPDQNPECNSLHVAFFECKRSLLDNRTRFRGKKGY